MKRMVITAVAITVLTFVVSGCGPSYQAPTPTPSPAPSQPQTGSQVTIQNYSFQPSTLEVGQGTTVTWTDKDPVQHKVVADDNSFSGPAISQGQTYQHTFEKTGTYNYHCGIHKYMKATIIVK